MWIDEGSLRSLFCVMRYELCVRIDAPRTTYHAPRTTYKEVSPWLTSLGTSGSSLA